MFVRGGLVDPGYVLDGAGLGGFYWSSVSRSSSGADYLGFDTYGVNPSVNDYRSSGFSVRCVALGGWT